MKTSRQSGVPPSERSVVARPRGLSVAASNWIAASLLVLFAALATGAIRSKTVTSDEASHLPAGFTYLAWGDFRLNPEHPPLVKILAGLPLRLAGAHTPSRDSESWRGALANGANQWDFGHDFLFATPGNDADRLLFLGRLPMVAVGVLLGVLLFLWARDLFGATPALGVLALYALDPNFLAHSALVTTDVAVACFTLGTCYFVWRCCRVLTVANISGAAVFLALVFASKFTAVLLAPMVVTMLVVRVLQREAWHVSLGAWRLDLVGRARAAAAAAALFATMALVAWGGVWSAYGFRSAPTSDPGAHFPVWTKLSSVQLKGQTASGWQAAAIARAMRPVIRHHLLPETYTYGLLSATAGAQARSSYLAGNISNRGRWWYFPIAIAVKTPLPALLLAASGLAVVWRRRGKPLSVADLAVIFAPPALYLAASMASQLNIGLRHVFPIFPFLYLLAGFAIRALVTADRLATRVGAAVLAAWLAAGTLAVYPHFLAYFNEAAGGPKNGTAWLADSNLDWGQDLRLLKRWMEEHGVARINLSYFGSADPDYYGIDYVFLPGWRSFAGRTPSRPEVPGYVAISATHLVGIGLDERDQLFYRHLLRDATLVDRVGYSIYVYYLGPPGVR